VENTATSGNVWGILLAGNGSGGNEFIVDGCHVRATTAAEGDYGVQLTPNAGGRVVVRNSVFANWRNPSLGFAIRTIRAAAYDAWIQNNTFVNNSYGYYNSFNPGTYHVTNNLFQDQAINDVLGSAPGTNTVITLTNSTTRATSTLSATPSDGNRFAQVFAFTSGYQLAQADTGAQGFGTDLSTDPTYPFSTDMSGATRTAPWDIGASEVPSSATELGSSSDALLCRTLDRTVASSSTLSQTETAIVVAGAVLRASVTRTSSTTAYVVVIQQRSVGTSAELQATATRVATSTAVLQQHGAVGVTSTAQLRRSTRPLKLTPTALDPSLNLTLERIS
jgi:hypothetical protein